MTEKKAFKAEKAEKRGKNKLVWDEIKAKAVTSLIRLVSVPILSWILASGAVCK